MKSCAAVQVLRSMHVSLACTTPQAMLSACRACLHAGHRALKRSDAAASVQLYTQALEAAGPLPPAFAAILHSNRSAAHQAKGDVLQAVADSLRARALNPAYVRVC